MGTLNITKRGKVYQYQFEVGKINGKRKRINKSGFRTKKEAEEAGYKAYNEFKNSGLAFKENNISYSDYLDYWLENYCKSNLRYNTIQAYTTIINKYLKPNLGIYRLSGLTSVKLNSFIIEMCNKYKFSRVYFSNILKVLKGSFREACDVYGFIKYNPTITLRLPRMENYKKDIKHVYTQEEIDLILNRLQDNDTFTCAFLTACYTGMRTGEVFALSWNDIDLDKGIISIKHSIYDKPKDDKGRWYIGKTKTATGTRQIHISNTLLIALKNYKKKQLYWKKIFGNEYKNYHLEDVENKYGKVKEQRIVENDYGISTFNDINLIFTKEDGSFVGTDILKYPYKIIHNELEIKNCRFYDLRGSYATKILRNGVEIKDVAEILGHNNIETTENYYISCTNESKKIANDIFEKTTFSNTINEIVNYKI